MNNPNPFVPKGSLLEQQSQRRSRLKIVVGLVLSFSIVCLIAMLIQGCHRENPEATPPAMDTNTASMDTNTIPPIDTNVAPPMAASPTNMAPMAPPVAPPVVVPPVEPPPTAAGTEYTIVSGDTLAKIAKKNGVTVKALEAANPGVDPKKLKVGKKLTIPGGSTSTAVNSVPATATAGTDTTGEATYVVKSGDTLSKIAKKEGVSLKALRAANPKIATTDHIHVGDKLVIPSKPTPVSTADTTAPMVPTPAPAPAPAPAPITPAPAPAPGH